MGQRSGKCLKVIKKIFQGFLSFLIFIAFLLLVVVVYNFWQLKILKKDYANYFGYTFMEVTSGSMADTINVNDYVLIKLTKDISEGDIITFKVNDTIITHRVLTIAQDRILTKGDANNDNDNMITCKEVIGKVVFIGHEYGIYFKVLKTPVVFITAFISLVLFDLALSDDKKEVLSSEEKEE